MSLLRDVLRGQRRRTAISTAGAVTHQASEALVPVLIGVIIDRAIEPSDRGQLVLWVGLLALLFAVLNRAYALQLTTGVRAQQAAEHDVRDRLAARVLDPGGLDGHATGSLLSVASGDARRTAGVVSAVVLFAGGLSAFTVAAVVLLTISLPLGLLVLLLTPPVVLALQRAAALVGGRAADEQEQAARASAVAADVVRGVRVLKGLGAEDRAAARYTAASGGYLRATLRAASANGALEAVNVLVGGLLLTLVAYVGGRLALDGSISVGDVVAAVGLTQFLAGPLERIAYAGGVLAQARASAARVAGVLAAAPVVRGGDSAAPDAPQGALTVAGLFTAAPGEQLGLMVDEPAEAARLLDELARRSDSDRGVAIDGTDLSALPLDVARRLVLVADHDAELFEGTVADNLGGARAGAIDAACVDDVGTDVAVGERGASLSGGQRQRVALARALGIAPPVLVLHDPTTAVDAVTEARIAAGVRRVRHGRTTLLMTSSPALLATCDRVLVVRDGAVAAAGDHRTLMETDAGYRGAVR